MTAQVHSYHGALGLREETRLGYEEIFALGANIYADYVSALRDERLQAPSFITVSGCEFFRQVVIKTGYRRAERGAEGNF